MAQGYVAEVRDGVLTWLESVRDGSDGWGRWKYCAHMVRPYGLQSSGLAVGILHRLGALGAVPPAQREEAVAFLRSCQDPRDGYFKDPLVRASDRVGPSPHSWEHIWHQMSGCAVALRALGGEPVHAAPRASFVDLAVVDPCEWTLGLDWSRPWRFGEEWAAALTSYADRLEAEGRQDEQGRAEDAFRTYEQRILDPGTGLPIRGRCLDLPVAMAALFKTMRAYQRFRRPVLHAKRAIRTTLDLQQEEGEFGEGANMCINWDALWVMRELDRQLGGSYRHNDIVASADRLAAVLLDVYRKPDGGFAGHRDRCWGNHNSIHVCPGHPEGDALGTAMCLRCLSYADEWNGG